MPPPLRVPARHRAGFRLLADLPAEQATELQAALENVPPLLATRRLAEQVGRAVPELSADVETILEAVLSLASLLPEDDPSVALELARDVSASTDLELDEDQRAALADRVRPFMALEAVLLAARARGLVTEHERVFHDARVHTDLRPVFGADASAGPRAAVLTTTLRIESHEPDDTSAPTTSRSIVRISSNCRG